MHIKIFFNQKILADFTVGSPKMVGLYLSSPNNGHNGLIMLLDQKKNFWLSFMLSIAATVLGLYLERK